jgi:polyisoprenoid-binding protein YceI
MTRRQIMQAPSGQVTGPALLARLEDGGLAGKWVLNPRISTVRLKTKMMGLVGVHGVFRKVNGHGTVAVGGAVSGILTVAAASIETGNTKRDTHLRSAEIFDSANHPDITFTVHSIRPSDSGVVVTGALTVRDQTRPLSFDAAASALGDGEIRLDAQARISRADFGLAWKSDGLASKTTTLTIHAVFARR